MDGWEFWQTAHRLRNSTNECDRRTAISRAYYAVYNGMSQFVRQHGLCLSTGSTSHGDLRNMLQGSECELLEDIGDRLGALHGARLKADYQMGCEAEHVSASAVTVALERAAQAKNAADELDPDAAVQGIRKYLEATGQRR